jgi:hypothetical protein
LLLDPLDPPQCLVHSQHEILIFLYFEYAAEIERIGKIVALDFAADVDQLPKVALLQALQLGVIQFKRGDDLGDRGPPAS